MTLGKLDAYLERIRGVRVLVIGDLMLDLYLRGTTSRVSPEAPVPVVKVEEEWRALGGAANVASNITALGASAELVGPIGDDRAGEDLLAEVEKASIGRKGIVEIPGRPTTLKTRIMVGHHQVARFDNETDRALLPEEARPLLPILHEIGPLCDAIVISDYDKGALTPEIITTVLETAAEYGIPLVVDPKLTNFFSYRGATVTTPNLHELETALEDRVDYDDPPALERVRARLGVESLLVTLGGAGMALQMSSGDYLRIPAVARAVFDVSGAGDTVTAVLASALGAGIDMADAVVLANYAAAVEVGKVGVATVRPDELREITMAYTEKMAL